MTLTDNIAAPLASALAKQGYDALTPVQLAVLAPELRNKDMLVSAQTGSGKTVAFGLALADNLLDDMDRLSRDAKPLALAIAPTRELALQVKRELAWLYQGAHAAFATCIGGMDMRDERRTLARGAHIVVGTPGRLVDHIKRGTLVLDDLRAVVLDEADEMLDLGFRDELEEILDAAPDDRRTLMFSATVSKPIANLAKKYQRDAIRVKTVAEDTQHLDIAYQALPVAFADRENAIINVLRFHEVANALVFCATRREVNHLTSRLTNRGFSVVALSGELSQKERSHALQAMRDGRARVCVATDVAARGIDLPNLKLVIHADMPTNREGLLHRSGRTGRAGKKGTSVLIVPHKSRRKAERLFRDAGVDAEWAAPPSAEDVLSRDNERLLGDPVFQEPVSEAEQALVSQLLEAHDPEKVAAAFIRIARRNLSAPEELDATAPKPSRRDEPRKPRKREERRERAERPERTERIGRNAFEGSVWVTLSVGSAQSAKPQWLLPMLCKAGQLSKRDIGAIRVQERETYVELTAESAEGLLHRIGQNGTLENSIRLNVADGAPVAGQDNTLIIESAGLQQHAGKSKPGRSRREPRAVTGEDRPQKKSGHRGWAGKSAPKPKARKGKSTGQTRAKRKAPLE